jgi:mannose-6-phosphate isomerase-like protein (cupin superfamily)
MNRSAWTSGSEIVEMLWGIETRWSAVPTITGKKLEIRSGLCTSLKFHIRKNEVLFVASGEVTVIFANERHFEDPVQHPASKEVLSTGGLLNVQAGCPYRVCANKDSIVYEISDGSSDSVVRLEDEYGRTIDAIDEFQFIYPRD